MTRRWSDSKRQKLISYILKFQFIYPRTSARRLQADNTPTVNLPAQPDPRTVATMCVSVCVCVFPDLSFVFAALLPFACPGRVRRLPRARPFFTLVTCIFDIAVSQRAAGREWMRCQLR